MKFKDWLDLAEAGTGTNCIAVVPTRLGQIRRRPKVKMEVNQTWPPAAQAPTPQNQPVGPPNPSNYKGANPQVYATKYQQYMATKDPNIFKALYTAVHKGDDTEMMGLQPANQPAQPINKPLTPPPNQVNMAAQGQPAQR